ncbi:phosphoribosylaminoimidazole-succinocarboxamide synthase [Geobacter metallireducens RCH3]|uniref:Phosphoribosylaminoimidazole-succinocarboxamide synthase n=1 Tax=Geobacter metallireducens (strain ATCC 53774 / DSM 7210 / GS-15) TaxID=269799 RepID=PUR7_GEOMG|nr:phosphoribosylaminoimidazolesuccinocarboxamide synthase [Geobacter metallireducens]Q39X66.1 RecName: Full=Phosphoribosylaminoimidazole-succinocarboxamide synthase; AltName: Full=SAICAR synthetase [Geobacter metallireducens GS-15]ABB31158.1 phosphoribosylaminoimidazole-succinocarboxamide synthase [Geobacter metallireducens GS-15]EHP85336.1 phosphoribosylaminoimidazole-succinocarboxamide synthase [Geobacter metallireducens RCH3]
MANLVLKTDFPDLKLVARGKVRDIYDLGEALLIVTTDRISAFDVIMNEGIPDKGYVLTQISAFWFRQMEDIIPNHIISTEVKDFPAECQKYAADLEGRSMLVKKANPLPAECIVRGYISGSGWKDYKATGSICGIKLPAGLVESDKLEEPIFTPSTKAELGTHDENISFDRMVEMMGKELAGKVRDVTIAIYKRARDIADAKGIIIADTKFEYGIYNGELIIIDECMTPDSSRFWPKDSYKPGGAQPSFDKQFLRDYLETLDWNKTAPAPPLPAEIVKKTGEKYMEALVRLTGKGK